MGEDWRLQAACRDVDPQLFDEETDQARAVCAGCPVMAECLAEALRTLDVHGYRGGKTGDERRLLIRGQRTREAVGARLNEDILRLHRKRWPTVAIARQLGVSRESVWRRVSAARRDGDAA